MTTRGKPADFNLYKYMQSKNTQKKNRFPLRGKTVATQRRTGRLQSEVPRFAHWLNRLLRDEQGRQLLRHELEATALPIIDAGA
jgi:hypothetical protein